MNTLILSLSMILAGCATGLRAAISVTLPGAGPLSFDATPKATEFATGVLLGTGLTFRTPEQLDAAVAGVHVTNVVRQLPTSATLPPSTFSGGFRHNTSGFFLQSRPNTSGTNAACVLLATLQNDVENPLAAFQVSYDFNVFNPVLAELPGFRVYFSLDGTPGSWQVIEALSGIETTGRVAAAVIPARPWWAGELFYLLWVDDNADGATDPTYTIDNFTISAVSIAHVPPLITRQPEDQTARTGTFARFAVKTVGNVPMGFQWRRDGSDLLVNAGSELILTNVQPSQNGAYDVVVTNSYGAVTSAVATLTVTSIVHLLKTSGGGGAVLRSLPGPTYVPNATITLVARPDPGWIFLEWRGDAAGTNLTNQIVMTRDKCVQALFGTTFRAAVNFGSGTVEVEPNAPIYPYGAVVRVAAIPGPGFYLSSWFGAAYAYGTNNPLSYTVGNSNQVIYAQFSQVFSDVTLTVVPEGFGMIATSQSWYYYSVGQIVTLTATPEPGQQFLGWSGDASGTQNPLQVVVNFSKMIRAAFTKRPTLRLPPCSPASLEEGFQFLLSGEFGARYQVEKNDGWGGWLPLGILTNDFGVSQFNDPGANSLTFRVYRAGLAP